MNYAPPTPAEVRALLSRWGLTGKAAAALLGITTGRQVRRWTGGDARMPFAALYTLAGRCDGLTIEPATWRAVLL